MIELQPVHTHTRPLDEKIIPMVNVIFLLLLFFLVAGSLTELVREDVQPARSKQAPVSTNPAQEWLLTREGALVLGERTIPAPEIAAWLDTEVSALPRTLRLRADARTRAADLLPLLRRLRERGVERMALVTISNRDSG